MNNKATELIDKLGEILSELIDLNKPPERLSTSELGSIAKMINDFSIAMTDANNKRRSEKKSLRTIQ